MREEPHLRCSGMFIETAYIHLFSKIQSRLSNSIRIDLSVKSSLAAVPLGLPLEREKISVSLSSSTTHQLFPNHQRWHAKWKLSWNIYTFHTRFCTFGADLYAQSLLISKISAPELSQKFIKSALLVGFSLSLHWWIKCDLCQSGGTEPAMEQPQNGVMKELNKNCNTYGT